MRKTLLSVLTGMVVVGAAYAEPTLDNRRAVCEKHPDKFVWVEKNETCVPINPCKSEENGIKESYCKIVGLYASHLKKDMVPEWDRKYIERVLGAEVYTAKKVIEETGYSYYPYVLRDGGYIVMAHVNNIFEANDEDEYTENVIESACNAYGYVYRYSDGYRVSDDGKTKFRCDVDVSKMTELDCVSLASFASRLLGKEVLDEAGRRQDPDSPEISYCWLKIDEK